MKLEMPRINVSFFVTLPEEIFFQSLKTICGNHVSRCSRWCFWRRRKKKRKITHKSLLYWDFFYLHFLSFLITICFYQTSNDDWRTLVFVVERKWFRRGKGGQKGKYKIKYKLLGNIIPFLNDIFFQRWIFLFRLFFHFVVFLSSSLPLQYFKSKQPCMIIFFLFLKTKQT